MFINEIDIQSRTVPGHIPKARRPAGSPYGDHAVEMTRTPDRFAIRAATEEKGGGLVDDLPIVTSSILHIPHFVTRNGDNFPVRAA